MFNNYTLHAFISNYLLNFLFILITLWYQDFFLRPFVQPWNLTSISSHFSLDGPSHCRCISAVKMGRNLLKSNAGGGSAKTRPASLLLLTILHLIVNGKKGNKRITQKHCKNQQYNRFKSFSNFPKENLLFLI